MTEYEINIGYSYLKSQIDSLGRHPGQIITKGKIFIESMARMTGISQTNATILTNIFISNGYISHAAPFIKLTDDGYELLNNGSQPIPKLYLTEILPINNEKVTLDQLFYYLWDIIGIDKDNNPYYVDGKTFYDVVKLFCAGLPSNYSEYISELKSSNRNTSRSHWCKDLFVSIGQDYINSFLNKLSIYINNLIERQDEDPSPIHEEISLSPNIDKNINPKSMEEQKKAKIFISHNTEDQPFAKALVDMLIKLGLNEEEDIFCSSVPGCGVKFGHNFIDTIKEQYNKFDLIILFIHSPRLYKSPVSLNEMGAGWVLQSEHKSFLTSDCTFDMLKGVITPSEIAFRVGQKDTYHLLNEFKTFIESSFNLKQKGQNRWDEIKNDFLKTVESIKY